MVWALFQLFQAWEQIEVCIHLDQPGNEPFNFAPLCRGHRNLRLHVIAMALGRVGLHHAQRPGTYARLEGCERPAAYAGFFLTVRG